MGSDNKKIGRIGEDDACKYLLEAGHSILDRNWRSGHYEIDIVTMDSKGIHFVEVKTRKPPLQAEPQDNVNLVKQQRLIKAAGSYLKEKNVELLNDMECFFDVVSVILDPAETRIQYFPEAFIPIYFGK